jgi:hypothetical protein
MTGCLTTMGVGLLVSLFEKPPSRQNLAGLTWSERATTPDDAQPGAN